MKKLIVITLLIAAVSAPAMANEPNKEWAACHTNSDCMVLNTGCLINGINKAYEGDARAYYKKREQTINCLMAPQTSSFTAVCNSQSVCVAEPKK